MTVSVTDRLNLYRFPSGRRLSCLRSMRDTLTDPGFAQIQAELDLAITAEWRTRDLEIRYRQSRPGRGEYSSETSEIDAELDRMLGALDDAFALALKVHGEDSPEGEAVALARSTFFSQGVRALIHMPYMEQEAEVAALLKRVEAEPELAEALRLLEVEELVDRIAEINLRYGEAIRSGRPSTATSYEEVHEARSAGHERLCWIVILATARLRSAAPGSPSAAALTAALEVVDELNAAIKRHRKRRRGVTDVDPEEDFEDADADDSPDLAAPMREPPANDVEAA